MSNSITEAARQTPIIHKTQLLVVGSGPGGLAAAIAASREGVETTLLERYGCFGGNLTQVGVEGFAWYRHDKTVDSVGIGIEFEERAKSMNLSSPEPQSNSHAIDGEGFKYIADVLVQEAGITPMLHRMMVATIMDGKTIKGVIVESKAGREAIIADRVIDATGDADVAYRSGAEVFKTPTEDMMAASVMFSMTGVDKKKFIANVKNNPHTYSDWCGPDWAMKTSGKEDKLFSPYLKKPFEEAIKKGIIPPNLNTITGTWGAISEQGDLSYLNLIHLAELDATNPDHLTRGEIEGRYQAMQAIKALKKFNPGCENAKLRNFGMTIGIRDTRKINAQYNMTSEDVHGQAKFDDSVGIFPEFIDGYGVLILPTTGRYFQLPYRSMIPRGVNHLLVTGRCVGGDKMSHAATRNMMCCAVNGQGAGVAAAESIKANVDVKDVSISQVQKTLVAQGARIH